MVTGMTREAKVLGFIQKCKTCQDARIVQGNGPEVFLLETPFTNTARLSSSEPLTGRTKLRRHEHPICLGPCPGCSYWAEHWQSGLHRPHFPGLSFSSCLSRFVLAGTFWCGMELQSSALHRCLLSRGAKPSLGKTEPSPEPALIYVWTRFSETQRSEARRSKCRRFSLFVSGF